MGNCCSSNEGRNVNNQNLLNNTDIQQYNRREFFNPSLPKSMMEEDNASDLNYQNKEIIGLKSNLNQNSGLSGYKIGNEYESYNQIMPLTSSTEKSDYYLICPNCKDKTPHINKIIFDKKNNDLNIYYNCICLNGRSSECKTNDIININKPLNFCYQHLREKLFGYCDTCKMQYCKYCKSSHKGHKIFGDHLYSPIDIDERNNIITLLSEIEIFFKNDPEKMAKIQYLKLLCNNNSDINTAFSTNTGTK